MNISPLKKLKLQMKTPSTPFHGMGNPSSEAARRTRPPSSCIVGWSQWMLLSSSFHCFPFWLDMFLTVRPRGVGSALAAGSGGLPSPSCLGPTQCPSPANSQPPAQVIWAWTPLMVSVRSQSKRDERSWPRSWLGWRAGACCAGRSTPSQRQGQSRG